MKKNKQVRSRSIFVWCVIFLLIIGSVVYSAKALKTYYSSRFYANTYINGLYCTGKTAEQVILELEKRFITPTLTVVDLKAEEGGSNQSYQMTSEQMHLSYDIAQGVNEVFYSQHASYNYKEIQRLKEYEITPEVTIDKDAILDTFRASSIVSFWEKEDTGFRITYTEADGYQMYNGKTHLPNYQQMEEDILAIVESELLEEAKNCLYPVSREPEKDSAFVVEFTEEDYTENPLSKQEEELLVRYEDWMKFLSSCDLIYDMGTEQIPFDAGIMARFVEKDEEGYPIKNEEDAYSIQIDLVKEYLYSLCDLYDTYGKERQFYSSRGEYVTVPAGTYGTQIDRKKEWNYLKKAILSPASYDGEQDLHMPSYKKEGYVRGIDDIGPTYIEVDMTNQKLYFYIDGELTIETDVVTGNMKRKFTTPDGLYYIYGKSKNRYLTGANYRTFVYYWMPVNKNIGLHDATWRDEFGGDIYLEDGSHGCVNLDKEIAGEIYELSEIGMPVIMYY